MFNSSLLAPRLRLLKAYHSRQIASVSVSTTRNHYQQQQHHQQQQHRRDATQEAATTTAVALVVATTTVTSFGISKTYLGDGGSGSSREPFRFGPSGRWMTTKTDMDNPSLLAAGDDDADDILISSDDDRNECPLCKKYSRGPCGEFFKAFLGCWEKYPGKNPDKPDEDWSVSKCKEYDSDWRECFQQYWDYYESVDVVEGSGGMTRIELDELKEAWLGVIAEIEQKHPRVAATAVGVPFPSNQEPILEIQLRTRQCVVGFHTENFVMGYVKDENGVLLSAGALHDLRYHDSLKEGYGLLQFQLQERTDDNNNNNNHDDVRKVTVYALCTDEKDNDVLYSHTELVPSGI